LTWLSAWDKPGHEFILLASTGFGEDSLLLVLKTVVLEQA
jgi:hypothetical protein